MGTANRIMALFGMVLIAAAVYLDPAALDTGLTVALVIFLAKLILG